MNIRSGKNRENIYFWSGLENKEKGEDEEYIDLFFMCVYDVFDGDDITLLYITCICKPRGSALLRGLIYLCRRIGPSSLNGPINDEDKRRRFHLLLQPNNDGSSVFFFLTGTDAILGSLDLTFKGLTLP